MLVIFGGEGLPGGGRIQGLADIRRHFEEAMAAFLTQPLGPDDYQVDAVGDTLCVRGEGTAVVQATGQQFTAIVIQELQIAEGKILYHGFVTDTACIRAALAGGPSASAPHHPSERGEDSETSR